MRKLLALTFIFSLILVLSSSCNKDKDKYLLKVRVTVNDSIAIDNALVHIYAPVEATFVDYFLYTDENGETGDIRLNNKAIVEIFAGKGTFKGCNVVEVEQGPQVALVNMKSIDDPNNGCDALE
ncbi:MAG TPA: hypothetical protein DCG19_11475 [Cryomorphaceae bacterium]|nr:hypothetical protein [Owenweeksia sp.]MBF97579.1 hypothetical protein [Owenweeksia sp.]HAD98018.1 hypothetical protein [Cryomorphaceae bacterium]HBF19846.1 hypothetical protein [Cryomorphaceae bacterium]|tara:strand:- start:740 stop:1111 length:372 start_codon:yes stop_codon:yes gene_type:complete